jgi:hypothetical protein
MDRARSAARPLTPSRGSILLMAAIWGVASFLLLEFVMIPDDLDQPETLAALVAIVIPCALPLLCLDRGRGFRVVTMVSIAYGLVVAAWGLGAVMGPVAVLQAAALLDVSTVRSRARSLSPAAPTRLTPTPRPSERA